MLERRSALAAVEPYRSAGLQINEKRGFSLFQAAVFNRAAEKSLSAILGRLPAKVGLAGESNGRVLMRVGPRQFWVLGTKTADLSEQLSSVCIVTPLSHSRTCIVLAGEPAREILAKGVPLDFHPRQFKPGMFAMTGLHHTPILIHCVGEHRFELYALRTFAVTVWEWLIDAALEFVE